MFKFNLQRVNRILLLGFITFFGGFIGFWEWQQPIQNQWALHRTAQAISSPLWSLNTRDLTNYLMVESKLQKYERIMVSNTANGEELKVAGLEHGPMDTLLAPIGLIPVINFQANVIYKEEVIGKIEAFIFHDTIYVYAYLLLVLGPLFLAGRLYIRTVEARNVLEDRVAERTEELVILNKDLKQQGMTLKEINEDLGNRNKELDEFTYIASHDLQEPLRKVTAFSSLLKMDLGDVLSEDAAENLHFLTDAASRMQALINDLLALSRSGRREMKREKISLDLCLDAALDALDLRITETGTQIIRDELPEVLGDRTFLTQLYQNLINNAMKFVQGKSPIVKITAEPTDQGLVLGVSDNGIGILEPYQEQIFAPFKRLHGRSDYSGTGIGLAICRKAVERHHGKIWVESEPGSGSHFKFTLL